MLTISALPERLRRETAAAHSAAEEAFGLPETVTSRSDYSALLARLLAFHQLAEGVFSDPRWSADWTRVGIVIDDHHRSSLLRDDLRVVGVPSAAPSLVPPKFLVESFAEALGVLYVLEGSALGGKVIGPMIKVALGDVPTRFYDSDGRGHPGPWRSLQAALRAYENTGGDETGVVHGAHRAFSLFGMQLAAPLWSSVR